MSDAVEHPPWYTYSGIEPWDVADAWDLDRWLTGALKYLCRRGRKPGGSELEDLRKAERYLQRRIAQLEAGPRRCGAPIQREQALRHCERPAGHDGPCDLVAGESA